MKVRHILKLCLALLLCCPLLLKAQSTQTNYEYWIDNNKEEAVSGTVNGEDINLSIDVGSLTTGVHFYNIRAYETVGSKKKWGTTYRYLFTIPRSANGVPSNLSRYEYWLDNDYEHRVTKSADDDESEVLLSLNLNTLLPGVHFYNFRAQNVDGVWGATQRYLFSIPSPQQETGSKLITGYSYAFNDGAVTNVVFDTPVDEYQLIKAFNVPQAQPPMVIDDDCSFVFDDEDNIATLSSNINMSFALFFKDQSGAMNSPVTSDFLVEDVRTQAIQSIAIPGTAAIVSHINGGFSVVCFDVASKTNLKMMTDGTSALRLYSPYSQLLDSYESSAMAESVTREFEEGTYYAVVYGNPTDVTFSLSPADPNVLKPKISFNMDENVVTMTCATPEASIYYTIDGSTPTAESTLYSAPFAIDKNVTIKAIAIWPGPFVSPIATLAIDLFEVDDVTFSQLGNTLTLATTTEGATIHYNVDGGEWLTYSNPLVMEGAHTVQAYADKSGYTTSNTTSYQFYYVRPVVATPLITHEGNTITISCTTIGATIYYTTDGTDPTVESSLYTVPLTVDSNCTIKAIAFKDGYNDSQVTTFEVDWIKICGYAVLDSGTGTLTFKYGQMPEGDNVFETENTGTKGPWDRSVIKTVIFESSYSAARPTTTEGWFSSCALLTSIIGIEYLNTSEVTNMHNMFNGCSNLESLDASHFNTSKVTNMNGMFRECKKLQTLDVSHFDTSNVTNMSYFFYNCNALEALDVSNFNIENVEYMGLVFAGCNKLTELNLTNFNTEKAILTNDMFRDCKNLTELDLSSFHTSTVSQMSCMFLRCEKLKTIYVGDGWTTENVTYNSNMMFEDCTSLIGGQGTAYDSNHTDITYAHIDGGSSNPGYFTASGSEPYVPEPCGYAILDKSTGTLTFKYGPMPNGDNVWETEHTQYDAVSPAPWDCPNLKKVIFDPSYSVVRPTSTADWFANADKLINISGLQYLNTSEVTDMEAMFFFCNSLTSLDVSGFDTRNVTNMAGLFSGCAKLTSLDLSNFNTEKVTSMTAMFIFSNLSCIDVSSFNTSNVKSMGHMFADCSFINNIDVSHFNTDNVTDMSGMFASCRKLTSLDLANFNTSNVTSMAGMFLNCPELTEVNVSSFNTSNVKNMRFMFARCEKLTSLDLSNFDTHNVTQMDSLFYGNDERSFQIFYVEEDVRYIPFKPSTTSNSQLKTIYVSDLWDTSNVTSSIGMFQGCISLVGSKGTTYNANYVDKTFARIDGGMSAPGYFSRLLLKGDVNDDGLIDMVDVVAMVNYILGTPSESFVTMAADLNSDGEIDVFDATQLVSMILAKNGYPAESRRVAAEDATQESALLSADGNSVSLNIDQPERFTAFQFEMDVPEGCELEKVRFANRSNRHGLRFAEIGENKYKVVGFSLGNELLHSQDGKLVEMQLSDLSDGHVAIGNVLFVTPDEEKTYFCGGTLSVVTGVDILATDKEEVIYDMSGRKQSSRGSLKKGVYIINGKKGVIK